MGVPYVDHFAVRPRISANPIPPADIYIIQAAISLFRDLGSVTDKSFYPFDHTHTNSAGAWQIALAFVSGLKCSAAHGVLAKYLNTAGDGSSALARCYGK